MVFSKVSRTTGQCSWVHERWFSGISPPHSCRMGRRQPDTIRLSESAFFFQRNDRPVLAKASRLFERVRDLQHAEVLFVAADDLQANGKSFRREATRRRGRWISRSRDIPA